MSFLNLGKTTETVKPPITAAAPTPEHSEIKAENIRKIAGFDGLGHVASQAPTSDTAPDVGSAGKRPSKKQSATQIVEQQKAADVAKAAELEARKRRVTELVGKTMMLKLAKMPYQVWSMFFSDPYLQLKPDEAKELADFYFALAQCYDPDLSKPIWILPCIGMMHVEYIADRVIHLQEKENEKKGKRDPTKPASNFRQAMDVVREMRRDMAETVEAENNKPQ